jgi:ubiquinone/menaquinone biosynthesis C-methylase UbiE
MNAEMDPTRRFSNRVDNYVRYRPGYPEAILPFLAETCGFSTKSEIADVGSGTGILSALFLSQGNRVYAVEPNEEMRKAAKRLLREHPGFQSVSGTAERTTLESASIDLVTAGQAFHWFDPEQAKIEFQRILRPGGFVVLVWNSRQTGTTPFMRAYEELLQVYALDYQQVSEKYTIEKVFRDFYAPAGYQVARFQNEQRFDLAGLQGRLLSSSYAPLAGHPSHGPMMLRLKEIYAEQQEKGEVCFLYDTEVFVGQVGEIG